MRTRALLCWAMIGLVARAVWLAPASDWQEERAQAERSREQLRACDARLGLQMRSSYVFLSAEGGEQAVRSMLFLTADGQLSQTLNAGPFGSAQQLLGAREAWAARSTPSASGELQTESGTADEQATHLLRARALIYEIALRFPFVAPSVALERDAAADGPEVLAWTCRRAAVLAQLRCDRKTGLPREIEVASAGLSASCTRWGPAPEGSRPALVPMPRALLWKQREPDPGPDVREELLEVQLDITCPADLLEAHRGAPTGKRVDVDALRAETSVERWPIRLETALEPGLTFAANAAGFAALLLELRRAPIAALEPGALRGRVLAWRPSEGRFSILEPSRGAATFLERGSEGLAIELRDPLGVAANVGPELRGASVSHLLWAAAEEPGPEGRLFSSLRLGILR